MSLLTELALFAIVFCYKDVAPTEQAPHDYKRPYD
jgi:hypothetical protein